MAGFQLAWLGPRGKMIKHTEETNKTKRTCSEESREKYRLSKIGSKNPMFGKKVSEETKMKMSLSHKGKIKSPEHCLNLSKALTGKKLSQETKDKISKANKGSICHWKGKKMSLETRKKMSLSKKGHTPWNKGKTGVYSEETIEKMSLSQTDKKHPNRNNVNVKKGEEHYNWNGGITSFKKSIRSSYRWKLWRKSIFERDDFTCQNPNCQFCNNKIGVILHPHHIIPMAECLALNWEEEIFDEDNGITYCKDYHLKSQLHKRGDSNFLPKC